MGTLVTMESATPQHFFYLLMLRGYVRRAAAMTMGTLGTVAKIDFLVLLLENMGTLAEKRNNGQISKPRRRMRKKRLMRS